MYKIEIFDYISFAIHSFPIPHTFLNHTHIILKQISGIMYFTQIFQNASLKENIQNTISHPKILTIIP